MHPFVLILPHAGYSSTSNEDEDEMYRKRKKARTAFSREQVADLEKKFQEKKYLSSAERGELAEKLKLSDMQVKTWFQNRRMKYKRQSEEAEMEMKSPKYPYSSFVSYGGMSPFYSYVPMPYKSHDTASGGGGVNSVPYTYSGSALRSPQTASPIPSAGGMDVNFVMNSPTMLGSLPSRSPQGFPHDTTASPCPCHAPMGPPPTSTACWRPSPPPQAISTVISTAMKEGWGQVQSTTTPRSRGSPNGPGQSQHRQRHEIIIYGLSFFTTNNVCMCVCLCVFVYACVCRLKSQ